MEAISRLKAPIKGTKHNLGSLWLASRRSPPEAPAANKSKPAEASPGSNTDLNPHLMLPGD